MSNYMITSNGIKQVDDNALMHWKYIKKKKINGKWRYYYDDTELKKAEENFQKADDNLIAKGFRQAIRDSNYNSAREANKNYPWAVSKDTVKQRKSELQEAKKEYKKADREYEKAVRKGRKEYSMKNSNVAKLAVAGLNFLEDFRRSLENR